MNKDWEPVFASWSKPPSETEEIRCDNAVSMVKKAMDADESISKMKIEVFPQGSYANNTNVKLYSDVDICVRNMDYLFCQYPEGKTNSDFDIINSNYSYSTFKDQVENALVNYFGRKDVTRGKKAFDIKSTNYRVEADVVACFEHRRYTGEKDVYGKYIYLSGTEFKPDNGGSIINWPKQHIGNGEWKNKETNTQFKKIVRIFKKLNLEMRDSKIEVAEKIQSFLIECLCWNTPNNFYALSKYIEIIKSSLIHLYNATKDFDKVKEWREINELKYLFRSSKPWKLEDVNDWTVKAWNYIGFKE
jgi:hypothetical protein